MDHNSVPGRFRGPEDKAKDTDISKSQTLRPEKNASFDRVVRVRKRREMPKSWHRTGGREQESTEADR